MNEKTKNRLFIVLAFLAGVIITAIIAVIITSSGKSNDKEVADKDTAVAESTAAPTEDAKKDVTEPQTTEEEQTKPEATEPVTTIAETEVETEPETDLETEPVTEPDTEPEEFDIEKAFPSWNPDSASLKELVDFVTASVDINSQNYIDPADRIATFDMDGTILCEKAPVYFDYCLTLHRVLDDPTYDASEEALKNMQIIRDHAYTYGQTYKPEGLKKHDLVSLAFEGMTPEEFRKYVVDYAENTDAVGFEGMKYIDSFYLPMIEVIRYLKDNDYNVYIVSASEREIVRAVVERFDIPYDHVIATDVPYVASGLGDNIIDKYNMSSDEEILLGSPLDEVECGKSGKPSAIAREIGKRPVLAFGNSSGDYSMLNYAEGNTKYGGMGFFVICDDTEREYGSDEQAAEYYEKVSAENWTGISMKNDWKTIYGENVHKTKLPLAEETVPAAA